MRLIDEEPRRGSRRRAGGVRPSVGGARRAGRIEAGRSRARPSTLHDAHAYQLGALELITLSDGFFRLDGGAMFGVVPRTLWEKRLPPDDRNRITLGMRPLHRARRAHAAHRCRVRRQDGRQERRYLRPRTRAIISTMRSPRPGWRRRRHRHRARQPPALRSRRRFHRPRRRRPRRSALSARRATSRIAANGRTRRIRTSATAPATCRRTSCRWQQAGRARPGRR